MLIYWFKDYLINGILYSDQDTKINPNTGEERI